MKQPRLSVTDKAVIRYLERKWGVDIDGVRDRIAREADVHDLVVCGSCAVRKGGLRFMIVDEVVVTVTNRNRGPYPRPRR